MKSFRSYLAAGVGFAMLVTIMLLVTGWGSAVAAQVTSVLVTNPVSNPANVHEVGTANVNVGNTALAVTDHTVTQVLFDGTLSSVGVGGGSEQTIDTSGSREIRVYVGSCPTTDQVRMSVGDAGELLAPNCNGTAVYDVPGTSVTFFMTGATGDTVHLVVYGRAN
jgi:hypothetical protein